MKNDLKIEMGDKVASFVDGLDSELNDKEKRKVCFTAYCIFRDRITKEGGAKKSKSKKA